jgi:hypothetical protein
MSMTLSRRFGYVATPLLLALLSGCSTSTGASHPTITTTTSGSTTSSSAGPLVDPSSPDTTLTATMSATASYLHEGGAALIAFEKATSGLGRGSPLSAAQCGRLLQQEFPNTPSQHLFDLATGVPDPIVRYQVVKDVQEKAAYLLSCSKGQSRPAAATVVRATSNAVKSLLLQLGISN